MNAIPAPRREDALAPSSSPRLTLAHDRRLALHGGTPVRAEFLTFGAPLIGEEEIDEVVDTLRSGWIGTGPKVHELESRFASYVGTPHAIALNSCTAGLELALEVVGVGRGDEVITSPITFVATANVIVHRGAVPVFADVDAETMNIDPSDLLRRITPRTKAIIPVHLAGRPCAMKEIIAIARRHGIPVVADAAHAIETRYGGRAAAACADLSVFSFYVTKNLTTAEGGMVTTSNAEWAQELRLRSLHGLSADAWKRYSSDGFEAYDVFYPGRKANMTDLSASLGLHQLTRIEENWQVRDRHWQQYRAGLADLPGVLLPPEDPDPGNRHARHLFVILLDLETITTDRIGFIRALRAENIGCGIHFAPVHLYRYYRETYGFSEGSYPVAEWVGERTLSLPLSAKLTTSDVDDVIAAVRKVAGAFRR